MTTPEATKKFAQLMIEYKKMVKAEKNAYKAKQAAEEIWREAADRKVKILIQIDNFILTQRSIT